MTVPETVICEPPGTSVWDPMMKSPAEFAVIVFEPTVMTGGPEGWGTMAAVLDPITTAVAPGAKLIGVPETVIAGPPGTRVCDPIMKSVAEFAVIVFEPIVMTGGGLFCGPMAAVLDPITTAVAPGAKLIGVPETVIAGPPGTRVCDPIMKFVAEFAVIVFEPTVMTGRGLFCAAMAAVLDPTTIAVAPGAKLIAVPETVIAGLPGARVWDPTTKFVAEFAVSVDEPRVITGATDVGAG
jgi:hypothetical protein